MIPLGGLVRDTLTGYQGDAVARIEHLHGVPEIKVVCLREGAIYSEWIDEAQLEMLAEQPAGFAPRVLPRRSRRRSPRTPPQSSAPS